MTEQIIIFRNILIGLSSLVLLLLGIWMIAVLNKVKPFKSKVKEEKEVKK